MLVYNGIHDSYASVSFIQNSAVLWAWRGKHLYLCIWRRDCGKLFQCDAPRGGRQWMRALCLACQRPSDPRHACSWKINARRWQRNSSRKTTPSPNSWHCSGRRTKSSRCSCSHNATIEWTYPDKQAHRHDWPAFALTPLVISMSRTSERNIPNITPGRNSRGAGQVVPHLWPPHARNYGKRS